MLAIEATAEFDGPLDASRIRVAHHEGRIYFWLGGDDDRVVEIDAFGWRLCDTPPVRFVRVRGMRPLPMPESGGALDDLRSLLTAPMKPLGHC